MKPKNIWISTTDFIQDLSHCLLLLESVILDEVLQKKNSRKRRAYSVLLNSTMGTE